MEFVGANSEAGEQEGGNGYNLLNDRAIQLKLKDDAEKSNTQIACHKQIDLSKLDVKQSHQVSKPKVVFK